MCQRWHDKNIYQYQPILLLELVSMKTNKKPKRQKFPYPTIDLQKKSGGTWPLYKEYEYGNSTYSQRSIY